ncbi:MAG: hypothetical protein QXD72_00675 [Candidatus Aenigmatarchaeota archaeon]
MSGIVQWNLQLHERRRRINSSDVFFWVLPPVVGEIVQGINAMVTPVSLYVHELGHLIAAKAAGLSHCKIELNSQSLLDKVPVIKKFDGAVYCESMSQVNNAMPFIYAAGPLTECFVGGLVGADGISRFRDGIKKRSLLDMVAGAAEVGYSGNSFVNSIAYIFYSIGSGKGDFAYLSRFADLNLPESYAVGLGLIVGGLAAGSALRYGIGKLGSLVRRYARRKPHH